MKDQPELSAERATISSLNTPPWSVGPLTLSLDPGRKGRADSWAIRQRKRRVQTRALARALSSQLPGWRIEEADNTLAFFMRAEEPDHLLARQGLGLGLVEVLRANLKGNLLPVVEWLANPPATLQADSEAALAACHKCSGGLRRSKTDLFPCQTTRLLRASRRLPLLASWLNGAVRMRGRAAFEAYHNGLDPLAATIIEQALHQGYSNQSFYPEAQHYNKRQVEERTLQLITQGWLAASAIAPYYKGSRRSAGFAVVRGPAMISQSHLNFATRVDGDEHEHCH